MIYTTGGQKLNYVQNVRNIMNTIWERREEFFTSFQDVYSFLDNVDKYDKPIILVDSGDITSAGGCGDSTEILRALLQRNISLKTVLTIVDSDAVKHALQIGEGNCGQFWLGAEEKKGYNRKIKLTARVVKTCDSPIQVKGRSFCGLKLNMGKRALLDINGKINLLVSEYSSLIHDPEVLRSMGVSPEQSDIIVQKSHKLFKDAYKDIAKSVVILDTPGVTCRNIRKLPFKKIKKSIYPHR